MKVLIKNSDSKSIRLFLPLFFLKSKFFWGIIIKLSKNDKFDYRNIIQIYDALKKYVKENGHFNLIYIESSDGGIIKIRV